MSFRKSRQYIIPPQNAQIDWSHPLAQWLELAVPLNGAAYDATGHTQPVVTGSASWAPSTLGPALSLPGTAGAAVSIPDGSWTGQNTQLTVSVWAKMTSASNLGMLVTKDNSNLAATWELRYSAANFQVLAGTASVTFINVAISPGTAWNHYAFTLVNKAGSVTIVGYFNGKSLASVSNTVNMTNGGVPIIIGGRNDNAWPFNGLMSEAFKFNRALSAAEIWALYTNYRPFYITPRRRVSGATAPPATSNFLIMF